MESSSENNNYGSQHLIHHTDAASFISCAREIKRLISIANNYYSSWGGT
jgi:hypothetical protein